ncbi:MAG: ATP-dependent helicase [Deltaproteobacteria bacterium]|nr:ATP-dependent helicase [Deltaproteobacteria bacterium]
MSIMMVGDVRQTLYGWRNARWDLVANFDKILDKVKYGSILKNYRSPKQLVTLSNLFGEGFKEFINEVESSDPHHPKGDNVLAINGFEDSYGEISWVTKRVKELRNNGISLSEIAILSRSNDFLLNIEGSFIAEKIPYVVKFDSRSVLNQSPFRWVYAMLSILVNPFDAMAFADTFKPIKGFGPKYIDGIKKAYLDQQRTNTKKAEVFDFFISYIGNARGNKQAQMAKLFFDSILLPVRDFHRSNYSFNPLIKYIAALQEKLVAFEDDRDPKPIMVKIKREQMYKVFRTMFSIYGVSLEDYEFSSMSETERFLYIYQALQLSQGSYDRDRDKKKAGEDIDSVMLSTIHSFKGLQKDFIFYVNAQPLMPMSPNSFEDRCVFYVAVTRSKKHLCVTYSNLTLGYDNRLRPSGKNPYMDEYISFVKQLTGRS